MLYFMPKFNMHLWCLCACGFIHCLCRIVFSAYGVVFQDAPFGSFLIDLLGQLSAASWPLIYPLSQQAAQPIQSSHTCLKLLLMVLFTGVLRLRLGPRITPGNI
jgi:hypothetical protein